MIFRSAYLRNLTEAQTLANILKFVSECKNEEQIVEIFEGENSL
jgi:hypothetical protein